jgi:hypothetical protein
LLAVPVLDNTHLFKSDKAPGGVTDNCGNANPGGAAERSAGCDEQELLHGNPSFFW